jgi:predicted metal-binding protein
MTSPVLSGCFHCEEYGHRIADCPYRIPPADEKEHKRRVAEYTRRFQYEEIGPRCKTRMIENENRLWAAEQKKVRK